MLTSKLTLVTGNKNGKGPMKVHWGKGEGKIN
jgi:hypothetical protein